MPVHPGHDTHGKYYQYGSTGKKYYTKSYKSGGALRKAKRQGRAIETHRKRY